MTMTYCRACGRDVHITHDDGDCPAGEVDLRVPDDLRPDREIPDCIDPVGDLTVHGGDNA